MNYFKRAVWYIRRKKTKTFLLLLLLFVANTTILGTMSVLAASDEISQQIQEKTNSKVVVEAVDKSELLNQKDANKIQRENHVAAINRMADCMVYPNSFIPVAGNEENDTGEMMLTGFDDMEKDSPFEANVCRLIEGNYAKNPNEVVINQNLADINALSLGDKMQFISANGQMVDAVIAGFYLTGNERQQTESVTTGNRIENQIYATTEMVNSLREEKGFRKIVAYVDEPEQLSQIAETLSGFIKEKAEVGTIDTVYQKMRFSILQIDRVTGLIFILTVVTSIVVIEMLLCMWMRNRKTEIAVFVSLGITKLEIFLQMLLEIWILYIISVLISAGMIDLLIPKIAEIMSKTERMELSITFSIGKPLFLCGVGLVALVSMVLVAMIPVFRKRAKDILAEMEG